MLTLFSVEGYKNFEEKYTFDLSDTRDYKFNASALSDSVVKCGLIYGKNTSGKTNLGCAIMDVQDNLMSRDFILRNRDDGKTDYLNADSGTDVAKFEYRFRIDESSIVYKYEKASRFSLVRERLEVDRDIVFDFDHEAERMIEGNIDRFGGDALNWNFADVSGSVLTYLCNNAAASQLGVLAQLYVFIATMEMRRTADMIPPQFFVQSVISNIIERDLVEELEAFLHSFGVNESLVAKETPDGERALYFRHKKRLIPFSRNCSSGTVALIKLFDLANNAPWRPSLYFIDEFDAFYHYDLAEKVINYLKNEVGNQVICTTHNTDLFSNKIMRPDCLFILSRYGISSAANATKRELREGHNLEKLYKAGEFDAQ